MTDQLTLLGEPERLERLCRVCGGAWTQPFGHTYVLRRQAWVKIGKSKHLEVRLKELHAINRQKYIQCPDAMDRTAELVVVAWLLNDIEHPLHERWAGCHVKGEWFLPDRTMRRWLSRL